MKPAIYSAFLNLKLNDDELKLLLRYLPSDCILDGEMYNLDYNLNQIQSIVTTKKDRTHSSLPNIKYYIFDVFFPENPPYEYRYNKLLDAYKSYLNDGNKNTTFEILASSLCNDFDELEEYGKYYISQGFEGMIIRHLAGKNPTSKQFELSRYQQKRSNSILKYKPFIDKEGTVVDIYEGTGVEKGLILFKVKNENDQVFGVRPRGSHEKRRKLFEKGAESFLGRTYTYRYQEVSEYGIPRFPVGIGFRDYMD